MIIRGTTPPEALSIKPKPWKFPYSRLSVVPLISNLKLICIIAWAFMTLGLTILSQPVQGASLSPEAQTLSPTGVVNFDEGVRIALYQSPFLTKSSLEVDIRKLDETDSRYALFPSVDFRTYYYLNRPSGIGGAPYSLNFSTDPTYNPIASYFSLQAQKLATQAAILTHIKTISAGLERLGQLFLDLEYLKNQTLIQKDLINLFREKLAYAENRFSAGTGTSLEVKEAQQGLKVAQNELEHIAFGQKRALSNMKDFLGLKPTQELTPDLQNTRRQVLGNFDPASVTFDQAKARSYDLKIMDILLKLQDYNIKLAKVRSFPTMLFTTQTPDPLSSNSKYGLYAGVGLYIPVWDGFKRIRNVSRQKTILKQYDSDKGQTGKDLDNRLQDAQEKEKETDIALQLAQSQIELLQLKVRQQETSYQSGGAILPMVLDGRKELFEAKKQMLQKALEHDKAVLALRQVSGDLGYTYVDANSWQK